MTSHEIPERHQRVTRALSSGGPAPALAAVAASVALAVLVVMLTSGGDPSARAFATISLRPATQPTPASDGALLALEPPASARTRRVGGVTLIQFRDGPRDVVMFERGGRTCVLAGEVLSTETLVKLASWRGGGAVNF